MGNIEVFASRMRIARKNKDWTQLQLSQEAKVSAATISAYENSDAGKKANPSLENIVKIAKSLEVSIDWLCGLTDNKDSSGQSLDVNDEQLLLSVVKIVGEGNFFEDVLYLGSHHDVISLHDHWELTHFVKEYSELAKVKNILSKEMFTEVAMTLVRKYAEKGNLFGDDDLPF